MLDFASLLQRARAHRDRYEGNEAAELDALMGQNAMLGAGDINTMRLRHGRERSQAAFNPRWDAWFQALTDASGGRPPVLANRGSMAVDPRDEAAEAKAREKRIRAQLDRALPRPFGGSSV